MFLHRVYLAGSFNLGKFMKDSRKAGGGEEAGEEREEERSLIKDPEEQNLLRRVQRDSSSAELPSTIVEGRQADQTGRQGRAGPSDLVNLLSKRGAAPSLDCVLVAIREAAADLPTEERKQLAHALLEAVSANAAVQGASLLIMWQSGSS